MDGIIGTQLICRACLKIVENKTQSFGFIEDSNGNLKDMIMCCVPEMDIYVSSNPIICFPCIQLLITVYSFKTRCLNTETIIRSYIQRNNLEEYNHVSLTSVVQELIKINSYIQEVQQRSMERNTQNMEGVSQCPNGLPKIPFPEDNFRILEAEENTKNHLTSMEHENLSDSEDVNKNRAAMQNQFSHQNFEDHHIVMHPEPNENDVVSSPQQDSTVLSQNSGQEHGIDNEIVENQKGVRNLQDNVSVVKNNCHSITNNASEESDGSIEDSNETASIEDNFKNSSPSECAVGKRPRLIIKICKNKITIPSLNNEDSNEKENNEEEVEVNQAEMLPPEPSPFDNYEPQAVNGQQLYQCSNCTFITTHPDYYNTHRNMCCSELTEKKCPHCPHVTNRQYALNKHINTMHTKSIWYTCEFCPYRSTDSSCLRRHKRNVHPEKLEHDLICHVCRYRCTTAYHLKKHMIRHKDTLALQCQFCSYSTRDRSNFRKHIFIHNPKPKNCEFCDYKCVSPYQMKLHLKRLHHGVGMEDVDCRSEVSINEVVRDISAAINEMKSDALQQTE